jgi:hypothetical protein
MRGVLRRLFDERRSWLVFPLRDHHFTSVEVIGRQNAIQAVAKSSSLLWA